MHYDVFLSYSNKDKKIVADISDQLCRHNVKVFFDDEQVKSGVSIQGTIDDALTKSRKVLIFLSRHSLQSDWVTSEIETVRITDRLNRKNRYCFIILDNVEIPSRYKIFSNIKVDTNSVNAYEIAFEKILQFVLSTPPQTRMYSDTPDEVHIYGQYVSDDGFFSSLSLDLQQYLRTYIDIINELGRENAQSEDDYIEIRRHFLDSEQALLTELYYKALLHEAPPAKVPWIELQHEIGRVFLEKRRSVEALEILQPLHASIMALPIEEQLATKATLSRVFDSIGEAIRFSPEVYINSARGCYEEALKREPNNYFALKHLGTILRIGKNFQDAEEKFIQARDAGGDTYHVSFSLGYLYSEWEARVDFIDKAKEQYNACERVLSTKQIRNFYRVYVKQAFLALREHSSVRAVEEAHRASNALSLSLPDDYVEVNRFATNLLITVFDTADERIAACATYLQECIEDMSPAVFDCVYRDLKREFDDIESEWNKAIRRRTIDDPLLVQRLGNIVNQLRTKEFLIQQQQGNSSRLRAGYSIDGAFPRLSRKVTAYLRNIPGRKDEIRSGLAVFQDIQIAEREEPFSIQLTLAHCATNSLLPERTLKRAINLLIDHSALVVLDSADVKEFSFDNSFWQPFTALVSETLNGNSYNEFFTLSEPIGKYDFVRIFSSKLIGADLDHKGRRVFVNPWVGCSQDCKFCYLPSYGIPISEGLKSKRATLDITTLVRALKSNDEFFKEGKHGTLISIGSFTEPFLIPKITSDLVLKLSELGNPTQIATRNAPEEFAITDFKKELGAGLKSLMINVSMNNTGQHTLKAVSSWLTHSNDLNIAIYVKPFLNETRDCERDLVAFGRKHPNVSFIVGSLYFSKKIRLSPETIKRDHTWAKDLKSPVVPHPTTPGMRHRDEEPFRQRLQDRLLGRTVFRTSSCALAAKMAIPDPLGNFGSAFCVENCKNKAICKEGSVVSPGGSPS